MKVTPEQLGTFMKSPNTYDSYYCVPPKRPGVYFFIETEYYGINVYFPEFNLVYIGSSTNLYNRYGGHSMRQKIQNAGKMYMFFFYETDTLKEARKYEKESIKKLQPKYNVQWR